MGDLLVRPTDAAANLQQGHRHSLLACVFWGLPARLHGWLHQHDDRGCVEQSRANVVEARRQTCQFTMADVCVAQFGKSDSRLFSNSHCLLTIRLQSDGNFWFHRSRGIDAMGLRINRKYDRRESK